MNACVYHIRRTQIAPDHHGDVNVAPWIGADIADIASFRPESSDHRPRTQARLVYTADALHGLFTVEDRYVVCRHMSFNDPVCQDSCVEFFVQPSGGEGYVNFEFNCGGTVLASHITDHRRTPDGFVAFRRLSPEEGALVSVYHSLQGPIEPETDTPVCWAIQFRIPFALFERSTGPVGNPRGATWRGNFYKCADKSSHPHWASWAPVDELNFHLPRCFGELRFE
jgi:hypothetical protein